MQRTYPLRLIACLCMIMAGRTAASPSAPVDSGALMKLEAGEIGLSISGKARSQFLRSSLAGDSARMGQPRKENAAASQADIDLIARPSAHTRGRLLFRIHQDWQSHYDEGLSPLNGRWFDYSGSILGDQVQFAIGDFRARHTPLTLYAAEPELLFEPEIFADRRQRAMDEWFLGDNRLPLQGINAEVRKEFAPSVFEIKAGATGARLRTVFSGPSAWFFWTDAVEKIMGNAFLETRWLGALTVGAEIIQITDDKAASRARNNTIDLARRNLPFQQPLYQDVSVKAVRSRLDPARWFGKGNFWVAVEGEYAMSNYHAQRDVKDSTVSTGIRLSEVEKVDGNAARLDMRAGYNSGSGLFGLSLDAAYLRTEKDFVNDMAQSPTFRGRRILNSLNEVGGYGRGYSTFDALYNYVYSVNPISAINSSEQWYSDTKYYNGTNNWFRAPFIKSSYNNSVTTRSERAAMAGSGNPDSASLDPHLQLLFPFGPATPNRVGVNAGLSSVFLDRKIEVKVLFAKLDETEGLIVDSVQAPPASFGRMGGGLSVDAGRFLGMSNRIAVSGGYVRDSRKRAAFDSLGAESFQSDLINAGVYAGVWKNLALLAGYQGLQSNPALRANPAAAKVEGKLTQTQWALGLEVKLTHAAYATAEFGRIDYQESVTGTGFSQDVANLMLILGF